MGRWQRARRHSERKARLMACAACRLVLPLFDAPEFREVVEAVEGYADGVVSEAALASARERATVTAERFAADEFLAELARAVATVGHPTHSSEPLGVASFYGIIDATTLMTILAGYLELWPARPEYLSGELFRPLWPDVMGPHEVSFDPEWWTDIAAAIAAQMYEARDFTAMPILADALQDAGCDDENVLAHCRSPEPHVRGCWVVDLVLGKE